MCVCASVDVSLRCNKLALGMYLCACVSDAAWQIARLKGLRLAIDKFMILMSYVVYQSTGKALGLCHVRLSLSVCVSLCSVHALYLFLQFSSDLMPPKAFISTPPNSCCSFIAFTLLDELVAESEWQWLKLFKQNMLLFPVDSFTGITIAYSFF